VRRAVACVLAAALLAGCQGRGDLDSPDPERRAAAVRALGGGDAGRALPALLVAQADRSVAVRLAAAEAFSRLGGPRAAEGLGVLLLDPEPVVVAAAAKGLAGLGADVGGKERLVAGYADASPAGRRAIAGALEQLGVSLREAVEAEARTLWERNLATLERGSGQARAGAAEELGASGRPEAVTRLSLLAAGRAGGDPQFMAGVARGLGSSGDRAVRLRLERLLADGPPQVAEAAADGLRQLGDTSAANGLSALAEQGGVPGSAAVEALGALPKAPEVAQALCAAAVRTADPVLAARAARLAVQRDGRCPTRPLLARLGRPGELAAVVALGELRPEGAEAEAASTRLLALLAAPRVEPEVRVAATRALGAIRWPGSAGPLVERCAAVSRRVEEWRAKAAPTAPGAAEARLPPDAEELGALLAAGGRLRGEGMEPLLRRALGDPAPPIRAGAVEGLGGYAGSSATLVFETALGDPAAAVRTRAAGALAGLGEAGVQPLIKAASATRPDEVSWREVLADALSQTGAPEATAGLAALLGGGSTASAAQGLARLGAAGGARPLAEWLARGDGPELAVVAEALGSLGGAEAGPVLAGLLTHDRAQVREAAIHGLGRIRFEPASTRLEALRADYHGRVRRAAVEALARFPARRPGLRP
jgi:HEAT repeat protein